MTYRERREARAERLRGWAGSNEAKAEAAIEGVRRIADGIPFGQPILVGHHSERHARRDQSRMETGMRSAIDHADKAETQSARADEIERQAAHAIYSDDVDAVEKLEERIADLEAERGRIKAYNVSCRKGARDVSLLDESQRAELVSVAQACPYQIGDNGSAPSYWLQNLGGNITRQKKRLTQLRAQAASVTDDNPRGSGRRMYSKYGGVCPDCGEPFERGSVIVYYRATREAVCGQCIDGAAAVAS